MAECNGKQGPHDHNSESTSTKNCNRKELNSLQCCDFDGQQVQIDATGVDVINVDLISNGTVLLGDGSTVKICQQCFRRQTQHSTQHSEDKTKGSADGSGVLRSKKRRRKRRKRSSQDPSTSRKCVGDGNSADSENSDGDETSAFQDFLNNDSDDD